ncbi:MAG: glycosyltransferase [Candidatus Omnitrophota bacterium]
MTVSIIIAVKTWQRNLEECVVKCIELPQSNFEIIILPDEHFSADVLPKQTSVPITIIPTARVTPAKKRDLGITHAKGEILAFLDDDAYPDKGWLVSALRHFQDSEVAAVAGPAVTPATDSIRQKASGEVYSSLLVSGSYGYRYYPKRQREVDDYPSCNFLVRKSVMEEMGGFNTNFWPGEDTKLCLEITKKLRKKIIYDPQVLVFHHRRPLFAPHLKQIASYALHRGYFVKRYRETSLRAAYFIPSVFLAALVIGAVFSLFFPALISIYIAGLLCYFVLVLLEAIRKKPRLILYVFLGIVLTHLTYGAYFIKGLCVKRLPEEEE